jgi:hypothetical protein
MSALALKQITITIRNDTHQEAVSNHIHGVRQSLNYLIRTIQLLDHDSAKALFSQMSDLHSTSVCLLEEIQKLAGDTTPAVQMFPYMNMDGRVSPPISPYQP